MSYPWRLLVVLLTFFLAPPVGAEDEPTTKPVDARRAALVQAGYTPVPLALRTTYPAALTLNFSVDGAVGPEKAKLFLDSGHQDTLLDLKLAKRLNLGLGEEVASAGLGGGLIGRRTHVPGLMIGPYDTCKDWCVAARALDLSIWPGWAPGGVLGMDVLDRYAAIVDYPARALYLRPPLATAWPRLAGTWTVTSWQEGGSARTLDPKIPPTFTFADRRLKFYDGGTTREFAIHLMPYNGEDVMLLFDPKQEGNPFPLVLAAGRIKVKNRAMTACLDLNKPSAIPTAFAAPKGSGYVLLELKQNASELHEPVDQLRDLLLKDGYTAVPLDRELNGWRTATARVNRDDLRLLVDTGASYSAFDTAGLDKWGAEHLGRTEVDGMGSKVKAEEVCLRGLMFGGYDTRRAWMVMNGGGFDLAGINRVIAGDKQRPIQGVFGNLDLLTGSAVIDFGADTLYLRPVKETVGPNLEGKWVGVRYESDGRKGRYNPGDAAIEFKNGRIRLMTPGREAEWGFHLQDFGDRYRLGMFTPGANELADGFRYSSLGLLKLANGALTLVTTQVQEQRGIRISGRRSGQPLMMAEPVPPTDFAAPTGSGLLLVEFERAK